MQINRCQSIFRLRFARLPIILATAAVTCTPVFAQFDTEYFAKKLGAIRNSVSSNIGSVTGASNGLTLAPGANGAGGNSNNSAAPSAKDFADQQDLFYEMLGKCKVTLDSYSTRADKQAKRIEAWSIGGAVAGLLGSALAGHAGVVAVSLLSGASGIANTAQQAFNDTGNTPQVTLQNRTLYYTGAMAAASDFTSNLDYSQRRQALDKLFTACTLFDSANKLAQAPG
jgi:hypothetical protein